MIYNFVCLLFCSLLFCIQPKYWDTLTGFLYFYCCTRGKHADPDQVPRSASCDWICTVRSGLSVSMLRFIFFCLLWAHLCDVICKQNRVELSWVNHKPLSGPEVVKLFSCSTQLSMKFFMLINLKLLTIANSFLLNIAEHENFSANKYENANYCWHFHIY